MPTEIVMPRLSDTMDRGTVARWNKRAGDPVKRGDVLLEIETDKANMDLESYADGILAKIMVAEGETADVGAPIGLVAADAAELEQIQGDGAQTEARAEPAAPAKPAPTPAPQPAEAASTEPREGTRDGRVKASPLARRTAEQRGVDLRQIQGTGPGGRITRDDVEAFAQSGQQRAAPEIEPPQAIPARLTEADEELSLSRMQQAVGRRLAESMYTAPHFYVTAEIDMTHAVRMRAQINEAEPDLKVSFNDLVVKAVGVVLSRFPQVNASYREGRLIRHGSVHVGMAVNLADGLIVPVVRDVDRKGLRQIAGETRDLAARARDGKLKQGDLEGGTFTVSNLGMFGVDQFTAIINPPESAILAVGAIVERPVVVEGEIAVRARMRVTLSCDHRVIYGADAAAFLADLRRTLEHPVLALL